jgi:hypothetical protein
MAGFAGLAHALNGPGPLAAAPPRRRELLNKVRLFFRNIFSGEAIPPDRSLFHSRFLRRSSAPIARFDHALVFSRMSATRRNTPGRSAKKLS